MLSIEQLKFQYASGASLEVPRFALAQGEVGLLLGPSGSGKTTLLSLIAGLLPVHSGHITVAGIKLQSIHETQMDAFRGESIGFIPQRLFLSAALTVRQNLLLAPFSSGRTEAAQPSRADVLLAELGIAQLANRRAHRISGGQAQRVAVARALMNSPKLLLADEPTASLDDQTAQGVIELLLGVSQRNGTTLLISSHDSRVHRAVPQVTALRLGA
jgi:putative ABC transport system ATP-binding protein